VPKATDARTGGRYLSVRKLEDISPEAIAAHLHDRVVRDEIGGKTANRIRSVISSMFSYARKYHGYVCPESDYKNPIEGVERFKETNPPIAWLKSEDITQQLDVLGEHPKTRALVATYIYAGLRRLEALWLMEDDIDLEERVIRIRSKTVEGEHWEPKTGQNRTVPISHKLLDELVSFLPYRQGVWFFSSPEGMRWNPDNFSQHLRKINKDSGLSWSCAEYRHTFGSHLAQKGVSLYKISGLMGNSPAICQKHYAAIEPQEMHDEVEF
jgi:integrase